MNILPWAQVKHMCLVASWNSSKGVSGNQSGPEEWEQKGYVYRERIGRAPKSNWTVITVDGVGPSR